MQSLQSRNLKHLGSERDDLHEPSSPQFAGHGTKNPCSDGFSLRVNEDRRVLIEFDKGAVGTFDLFFRTDDYGSGHVPFLNLRIGHRILHGDDDDVPQGSVFAPRPTENLDAP
jgi:hypothetical protein